MIRNSTNKLRKGGVKRRSPSKSVSRSRFTRRSPSRPSSRSRFTRRSPSRPTSRSRFSRRRTRFSELGATFDPRLFKKKVKYLIGKSLGTRLPPLMNRLAEKWIEDPRAGQAVYDQASSQGRGLYLSLARRATDRGPSTGIENNHIHIFDCFEIKEYGRFFDPRDQKIYIIPNVEPGDVIFSYRDKTDGITVIKRILTKRTQMGFDINSWINFFYQKLNNNITY